MIKNKKGKSIIFVVIGFLILAVIFSGLVGSYRDAVDETDSVVLSCLDGVNEILNESIVPVLCCNQTDCGGNSTPSETGLTGGQESLMILYPTLIIIGMLVLLGAKFGLLNKK